MKLSLYRDIVSTSKTHRLYVDPYGALTIRGNRWWISQEYQTGWSYRNANYGRLLPRCPKMGKNKRWHWRVQGKRRETYQSKLMIHYRQHWLHQVPRRLRHRPTLVPKFLSEEVLLMELLGVVEVTLFGELRILIWLAWRRALKMTKMPVRSKVDQRAHSEYTLFEYIGGWNGSDSSGSDMGSPT